MFEDRRVVDSDVLRPPLHTSHLVVLCVALRLMAWLVAPAIPLLAILLAMVGVVYFMLFGRRG